MSPDQGRLSGIIRQRVHLKKTVLEVSIRIGGRSSDEVQHLDNFRLRHDLNHTVKLGLTARSSLKVEQRLRLDQPGLDVIWPERRELHSNSIEQVSSGENDRNYLGFLDNSRISRHGCS